MSGAAWTGLVLTTTAAVTNNASTKTIDPTRRITSPSLSRGSPHESEGTKPLVTGR